MTNFNNNSVRRRAIKLWNKHQRRPANYEELRLRDEQRRVNRLRALHSKERVLL